MKKIKITYETLFIIIGNGGFCSYFYSPDIVF